MRCFSVTESSITPYLTLSPTPYPHIGVGEMGRGREYTRFPVGVTVLAEGYEAQGAAGRMGGHAVRLLILEPGAVVRVLRLGRLYGAPAARYVAWDGETLHLGTRDEIYPPSEEAEGEVI